MHFAGGPCSRLHNHGKKIKNAEDYLKGRDPMIKQSGNIRFMIPAALVFSLLLSMSAAAENSGEISLEKAYRIALEENEQVRISRQDLRKAETDITSATSNLYPQLSLRGAYTREKDFDFSGGTGGAGSLFETFEQYGTLTLRLEQHVYQWGKVWSSRQIAAHYFKGSRFRHLRRVQEVLYQVSTRYYEVLLGRRSIEIAESALKRARQQLSRAKAQYEVGVLTQTDVLRAEVQAAQSREQLERAKNQYDIAKERLALEMGIESVPGMLKEPEERSFSQARMPDLYDKALENRQDFSQAEKELLAAKERVNFEQADYFPNISLTGEYTRTDEEALFYGEPDDWQASVVVSYPLFTGWKTSAEVDRAKSEKRVRQKAAGPTR